MYLYLIVHPCRALTARRFAVASMACGHTLHAAPTYDPAVYADVLLVMPHDDRDAGRVPCAALWPQLQPTTGRMVLVAPTPLQVMCAYLQDGADDCQPLTRHPLEIVLRCVALARRRAPRVVAAAVPVYERTAGELLCVA